MATFDFGKLTNGQHIAFDPQNDILNFGNGGIEASKIVLRETGGNLTLSYFTHTIVLDDTRLSNLHDATFNFAGGTSLLVGSRTYSEYLSTYGRVYDLRTSPDGDHVEGLLGADRVMTGAGDDLLVGNLGLAPLNHILRKGSLGSELSSGRPAISADGKLVVFEGDWSGFGTDGGEGIIVKNLATGAFTNENMSSSGAAGGFGAGAPVISANGKFVAFTGASAGLVDGGASGALYDIYVASTTGNSIVRVSTASDGALAANGRSLAADISASGRYVVFESDASNLVAGGSSAQFDIFLKDTKTGLTTRVSTSLTGTDGNGDSRAGHISANGRYVVYQSEASNLSSGDNNGYSDVFLWDANTGTTRNLTKALVTVSNQFNGVFNPDVAVRDNGDVIVIFETGRNFVDADTSNGTDIYAYNVTKGTLQFVSSRADGSAVGVSSGDASISDDGRWVVFTGGSDTLVPDDNNGYADVFIKDLVTGEIALLSRTAAGASGNGSSTHARISSGGDWIVFESGATDLAATDANGDLSDVFRVSNPLLKDTLVGGDHDDTYVLAREDIIVEQAGGGIDTVRASFDYVLGANLEKLVLTGSANLDGTGNGLANGIDGNGGNNRIEGGAGADDLDGKAGNDRLLGGAGGDKLEGGAGNDVLTGGTGADVFRFTSLTGSDRITDFVSGTDSARFSREVLPIGDGDLIFEQVATRGAPGGFAANAEMVVFTSNLGSLGASSAAAGIGSATSAMAVGRSAMFVVDNGADTAVYRFVSADGNARVSASELSLVVTFEGTAQTVASDYMLVI